jgi:hypothetical protein
VNIISAELRNLITWTHSPEPERLKEVLAAMTDGDLMLAMTHLKADPAGRIAWAEYGRRVGYIDFEIRTVVVEGRIHVTFEGEAKPIHHGTGFEVKS